METRAAAFPRGVPPILETQMHPGIHSIAGRALVAVLAFALFVGCSGSGNAEGEAVAGQGTPAASAESASADHAASSHPIRVSQGQEIELTDYAVAGQYIVFDFMSDYCPPCLRIAPWMDRLHAESDEVTVVKVDINRPGVRQIDWQSPVAAQFSLSSIPHFKVMDGKGNLVAEGDQAWEMVVGWLQELDAQQGQGR
jgi:thiol-disulfide isomerase/thioredoxin